MPKYKVGDVAALFPKPTAPKTETEKKLQSLFEQLHNKPKPKLREQVSQPFSKQGKSKSEAKLKLAKSEESALPSEQKKKKLKGDSGLKTNFNVKEEQCVDEKYCKVKKRSSLSHTEVYFPRSKKKPTQLNNILSNVDDDYFDEDDEDVNLFQENDSGSEFNMNDLQKKNSKKAKQETTENDQNSELKEHFNCDLDASNINLHGKKIKKCKKSNLKEAEENKDKLQSSNSVSEMFSDKESLSSNLKCQKSKKLKREKKLSEILVKTNLKEKIQTSTIVNSHPTDKLIKEKSKLPQISLLDQRLNSSINENTKASIKGSEAKKPKKIKKNSLSGDEQSVTLFVGNLPVGTTREDMKKLFAPFGAVKNCRIRGIVPEKPRIPKKSAGIINKYHPRLQSLVGYVAFANAMDAKKALKMNGQLVGDHHIVVNNATASGEKSQYDPRCSVFVGNLPYEIPDDTVRSAFVQCGEVEAVRVVRDRETGAGKGFAYVLFKDIKSKNKALALKDVKISDRELRIKPVEVKGRVVNTSLKHNSYNAIRREEKGKYKKSQSRPKSLKKLMKKRQIIHEKKKVANVFQKFHTFRKAAK